MLTYFTKVMIALTCLQTYLTTVGRQRPLLMLEAPAKPKPDCKVCQTVSATANVNFERAQLQDVLDTVVVKGASLDPEEVAIMDGNRYVTMTSD